MKLFWICYFLLTLIILWCCFTYDTTKEDEFGDRLRLKKWGEEGIRQHEELYGKGKYIDLKAKDGTARRVLNPNYKGRIGVE